MSALDDILWQATDWHWRCPTCNKTSEESRALIFRLGTSGTTRTLGRCGGCNAWKMLILERASQPLSSQTTDADRERTWSELISYVSEASIPADLANKIAQSIASEQRKREVAAHLSEGALSPEDALNLLRN